jgi:hypothetical protein
LSKSPGPSGVRQGELPCSPPSTSIASLASAEARAAPPEERAVPIKKILNDPKAVVPSVYGSYAGDKEMAGFSVTLMKLDKELKRLYDLPASSLAFSKA